MQINTSRLWNEIQNNQVYPQNEKWHAHFLDQYKLYVEMADRISQRRIAANTYFLSVNSALVGLVAYLAALKIDNFLWLISISGLAISVLWYAIIKSYKNLSQAKWNIVHQLEQRLPARLYEVEWGVLELGTNPLLYRPVSHIEKGVPWIFFLLHLFVVIKFSAIINLVLLYMESLVL